MRQRNLRDQFLGTTAVSAVMLSIMAATSSAQLPQQPDNRLKEPIYRVSKASSENISVNQHPLDPALALARDGLRNMQENVRDYTCVVVKRERIGGELGETEYMFAKVRNEQVVNGRVATPFSVYLYFLKPENIKGREVIYVKGHNDGKLIAHEPSNSLLGKFGSVWLRPDGAMAMKGNRYPITELGMETLVRRLIEKGERDRKRGECDVIFRKGAKINGRVCTMLEVTHPVPREYFDFHKARIFIDDELNIPIRYAAYNWPAQQGGRPQLTEEYTYTQVKLNVGLTDHDFDPENTDYRF